MFSNAHKFNQPVNNWNVSNATIFDNMFACLSFNQPLSNWNVSNCSSFRGMFSGNPVFNQDISMWKFSKTKTIDVVGMISGANNFNKNIGNWDLTNTNFSIDFSVASDDTSYKGYNPVKWGVLLSTFTQNASFIAKNVSNARQTAGYLNTPITAASQAKYWFRSGPVTPIPSQFKLLRYEPFDLRILGYQIPELIFNNYTLTDFSNSGFKVADYTANNYTITNLFAAGFSVDNLAAAGYTFTQMISANIGISNFANSTTFNKTTYSNHTFCFWKGKVA